MSVGKIKNESGEARTIHGVNGRFVPKGAVIEVPIDEVYNYTQQEIWSPADPAAKKAHAAGQAAYEERLAAQAGQPPAVETAPDTDANQEG